MSRKYDRTKKLNLPVRDILEDPATLHYLGTKLFRKKPKLMPRLIWKFFLFVVMAPATSSLNG
jgi:hypothetical protein